MRGALRFAAQLFTLPCPALLWLTRLHRPARAAHAPGARDALLPRRPPQARHLRGARRWPRPRHASATSRAAARAQADDTLLEVAQRFASCSARRMYVMDPDGKPVAVVSLSDFMHALLA